MNLTDITSNANGLTDETFTTTLVKSFVNEAISKINIAIGSNLPLFTDNTTSYIALPDSWVYTLLIPYAAYGIKRNDGSLNEANIFLADFNKALVDLDSNKYDVIAESYRGANFDGIYKMDMTNGINVGWFGRRRF